MAQPDGNAHGVPATLRVLVTSAPHVPSYFNAGHHLALYMTSAYLRRCDEVAHVDVIDGGVLAVTWKELADAIFQGEYDVIAVMNDYDAIDGTQRLVDYVRTLSPASKLVAFGRVSSQVPRFFQGYGFDAIVREGDWEAGVAAFVRQVARGGHPPGGVSVAAGDGWHDSLHPGELLDPSDWALPDVREIPYAAHDRMYHRDANKFCGIPERRELVVPIARGCPVGCAFCEVPKLQGLRERRLPVDRTLEYIEWAQDAVGFEYVAFYAPTFTLNRRWVAELCEELIARGSPYPWKCSTTLHHLSEEMVAAMGESGCVRISVGLETLDEHGFASLPRLKRTAFERFEQVAGWCREHGVELNCFVILGLPGTSVEGVEETVRVVRAAGARLRPTMYSPIDRLHEDMTEEEVAAFNKQIAVEELPAEQARRLYAISFGPEPAPTRVMDRIPVRAGAS